jgi:hypothetical protein
MRMGPACTPVQPAFFLRVIISTFADSKTQAFAGHYSIIA